MIIQKYFHFIKLFYLVGLSNSSSSRLAPPGQPPDNSIHEKDEDFVVIDYDSNQQLSLHPDNRLITFWIVTELL